MTPIERWRAVPADEKLGCLQSAKAILIELEQALATVRDPSQAVAVAQSLGGDADDVAMIERAMVGQIEAWQAAIGLLATIGG